jgi:hypothetical protein
MKNYSQKIYEMKKVYIILIGAILSLSCNKILGKTCWKCTVYRFNNSDTYEEKVCQENYPEFYDNNGNELNSVCEKK